MPETGGIPLYVDPVFLQVGWLQITWRGVFTALATLVAVWLALRWARRAGLAEDETINVAMWGVIGGVIGARLFHVVDRWDYYAQNPLQIVQLNQGGLAVWGSVVLGPLVGALYARWARLPVARFADVAAAPLAVGLAIGRLGDVLSGEQHGLPAPGFPLAVVYTHPNTLGEIGVPVHLAVGYELVLDLAIFVLLVWLARGLARRPGGGLAFNWAPRPRQAGTLFWIFLVLYAAARFVSQLYRADMPSAFGVSQAQLVSVLAGMVAIWALVFQLGRAGRARQQPASEPGDRPVE